MSVLFSVIVFNLCLYYVGCPVSSIAYDICKIYYDTDIDTFPQQYYDRYLVRVEIGLFIP